MTEIDPQAPLRTALAAVLRDTAVVEHELALLHGRLGHLHEAASGLIGLLGQRAAEEVADEAGVRLPQKARPLSGGPADARRLREAVAAGVTTRPEALRRAAQRRLEQPDQTPGPRSTETDAASASSSDSMADATSTDKVVELLREFDGRAIPRQMIIEEFSRRGWVDPSWKEPEAAIRMAIKRAVERGEAAQVGNGRYMHKTPDLFQSGDGEGGGA